MLQQEGFVNFYIIFIKYEVRPLTFTENGIYLLCSIVIVITSYYKN